MQYLGGKASIAPELARAVLRHTTGRALLLEPFCGAASVTSFLAPHFARVEAADTNPDLCLMLEAVRDGWRPPEHVSREEYYSLKFAAPSALRGFVGFGCSFGGDWFHGYATANTKHGSMALSASRSLSRKRAIGGGWSNVKFYCRPYWQTPVGPGAVLYCDPPYAGLWRPGGARKVFDSSAFWEWASRAASVGAEVLVSEQSAPQGWECLAEFPRRQGLRTADGSQFREALFRRAHT